MSEAEAAEAAASTEAEAATDTDATASSTDTEASASEESTVLTDGGAGDEGSPETYADFVMPEGVIVDEATLATATPLFQEMGLSQEQSQKLVDIYAKQVQAAGEEQADSFNQLMDDWKTQSETDSEFGGDAFAENVKIAQSAIETFGTPELKTLLNEHGVGNHPEVIRFMIQVGKTLKEDSPGNNGSAPKATQDNISILYPTGT